jgi:hypothetical protein
MIGIKLESSTVSQFDYACCGDKDVIQWLHKCSDCADAVTGHMDDRCEP